MDREQNLNHVYKVTAYESVQNPKQWKVVVKERRKPYRRWKVTIKEVGMELPIHTEYHGHYDLNDVREHFGLEAPDVEWYKIEDKDHDNKC